MYRYRALANFHFPPRKCSTFNIVFAIAFVVICFKGNISPVSAANITSYVSPLESGSLLELTCKSGHLYRDTFFAANSRNCSLLEQNLSNFTKIDNGVLKLSLPTAGNFKGRMMIACTSQFKNEPRLDQECAFVDFGSIPEKPRIRCEAPNEREVECEMKPSKETIWDNTGLRSYPFNISISAASRWDESMIPCHSKTGASCPSKCCFSDDGVVIYKTEKIFDDFAINISLENPLGPVSVYAAHDMYEILLLDFNLSASFNADSSEASVSWGIAKHFRLRGDPNETEVVCESGDRELRRNVFNSSVAVFHWDARAYFSTFLCKHRSRLILRGKDSATGKSFAARGVWSKWKRTGFMAEPPRVPDVPVPSAFPALLQRRDEDCFFYFFDPSEKSQEFAIRSKERSDRWKFLFFKFRCRHDFSTILRIAARAPSNSWSIDAVVPLSHKQMCADIAAPNLSFKRLPADGFYEMLPVPLSGTPILETFLVICFCDSCRYPFKCTRLQRIDPVTKDPPAFAKFAVRPSQERVALSVTFRLPQGNCSVMSDWTTVPAAADKQRSFAVPLTLALSLLAIALLVGVIKANWGTLLEWWGLIAEDRPTQDSADAPVSLKIYSAANSEGLHKSYEALSGESLPNMQQPLSAGGSQGSLRSGYTQQEARQDRGPSYPQQGVAGDDDLRFS